MSRNNKVTHGTRSITMRDVAQLAGVSQTTVSRVLSQATSPIAISEETYKRVQDAIEQLGYYPNIAARSLRGQPAEMIAIMIADISNPFYHTIVQNVQDVSRRHNFDVVIANTDHAYDNEIHFCEAMMRRPVDGIIMVPYHLSEANIDQLIQRTGVEVVAMGEHVHHPMVDVFHADDENATFEATEWMIQQKHHRRIGFIAVQNTPPGDRRNRGYTQALLANGIEIDPELIVQGDWSVDSGYAATQKLLALKNRPTMIFACNDHMAIGALNCVLDCGLRIPKDVAIVGFDNIPTTTLVRPKLTTIAQFPVEIGNLLAQALFERIENVYSGPRRTFAGKMQLIEREST
ncbi:MAG: LacI family DNA-binding transcriptional regulator [Chloroflexota bacterium]